MATVVITALGPGPWELTDPIYAVVQPAGEGFTASFFDANISASGDTQQEAVDNLKDIILLMFEDLQEELPERLGPEPVKQLPYFGS